MNFFEKQREEHPHGLIIAELALALLTAIALALLWEYVTTKHVSYPTQWKADDVLAVLAIAFAVVQFLDSRLQEAACSTSHRHPGCPSIRACRMAQCRFQ